MNHINDRTGELINRLSADTTAISKSITGNLAAGLRGIIEGHLVSSLTLGIGGVAILFWIAPKLTLVMLTVIPPVAIGGVVYGRFDLLVLL